MSILTKRDFKRCKYCEVICLSDDLKEPILDIINCNSLIKEFAYILHDKEYRIIDNHLTDFLAVPHYHIFLEFYEAQRYIDIAFMFGLTSQQVFPLKNASHIFSYFLVLNVSFFTFQYRVSDLHTNMNLDNSYYW